MNEQYARVCVLGVSKRELQVKYLYQEPFSPQLNWIWKVSDKGKLFQIFNFTIYFQNCLILILTTEWSGQRALITQWMKILKELYPWLLWSNVQYHFLWFMILKWKEEKNYWGELVSCLQKTKISRFKRVIKKNYISKSNLWR